jgi:hypothetical protein
VNTTLPIVTSHAYRSLFTALCLALVLCASSCAEPKPEVAVVLPDPVDSTDEDLDGVSVAPMDGLDGPSAPDCDPSALRVIEVRPWTGGGVQVALELLEEGTPVPDPASVSVALVLEDGSLEAVPVGLGRVNDGLTALLLVPQEDGDAHEETLQAAHQLVDALESSERIAILIADEELTLMADLTTRRSHLHTRIDEVTPRLAVDLPQALASSRAMLSEIGGAYGPLSREIISVDGSVPGAMLAAKSKARRTSTILVGVCPDGAPLSSLTLATAQTACTLSAPEIVEHVAQIPCDAAAAAADAWPWPDTIGFELNANQMEVYDAFHAALDKSDMTLQLTLGASAPIEAQAHFRGQSSLDCARKSYTVNLKGSEARRLAPGAANDEFYLIGQCLDDGYFRQLFANAFYREHGLFPLDHRLVEVTLNGESQGAYMLLEKPDETLPRDHLALEAVIRRRFDPEDKPEDVKFPKDAAQAAEVLGAYKETTALVQIEPPESLGEALDARIDLDRHLLYLAFQAVMQNGDYVDEAYFYGVREGENPSAPLYFRPMGWDSDDLFSVCHHQGVHATPDPHGVAFCVEGDLELAIYAADDLYVRFAEHVETLLTQTLTPDIVAVRVGAVRDELFSVLDDEASCAAMVEVGAADCAGLHAHIEARMGDFLGKVAARNDELLDALSVWKAGR